MLFLYSSRSIQQWENKIFKKLLNVDFLAINHHNNLSTKLWLNAKLSPYHIFVIKIIKISKNKFCFDSNLNNFLPFFQMILNVVEIFLWVGWRWRGRMQILESRNVLTFQLVPCHYCFFSTCFRVYTTYTYMLCIYIYICVCTNIYMLS